MIRFRSISLLTRYIFILAVIFHGLPSVGQAVPDGQLIRDSLYRHISREMSAESAFYLTYPLGKSTIVPDLSDNATQLSRLSDFIRMALQHPDLYVGHIYLTGYSSIEGPYRVNDRLSRERVEQFYLYLRQLHPEIFEYSYSIASVAEDWKGLSEQVRNSMIDEREEVLDIIRRISSNDEREHLIRQLNGGRVYREIEHRFFPLSRRVEMRIEYSLTPKAMPAVAEPLVKETPLSNPPSGKLINIGLAQARKRVWCDPVPRTLLAIKTNALLWAGVQSDLKHTTITPNLSVEYFFNPRWSVELGAIYSYWHYNQSKEFQGLSGYRLEPRFYIPLGQRGPQLFLGLYGRVGDYDIQRDPYDEDTEAAPCHTGDYWDAGLSAGCFFPLWKGFGIEAGARAGYVSTNAIRYTPIDGKNTYSGREKYNKFRMTNIDLNLVYRFRK